MHGFVSCYQIALEDWLKAITEGDTIFLNKNDLLSRTKVLCLTKKSVCKKDLLLQIYTETLKRNE